MLVLTLLAWPASADNMTGNVLWDFCRQRQSNGYDICLGYINGVADTVLETAAVTFQPPLYCLPRGGTRQQMVDVVIKRLRESPELRSARAPLIIIREFQTVFPCRR